MGYEFFSDRLHFRLLEQKDVPDIFEIVQQHPEVARFMTWNPPQDFKEAHMKFLETRDPGDLNFGLFLKEDGPLIGRVTIRNIRLQQQDAFKNSCFLSFWISPEYQGQKFGTEMLTSTCRFVFTEMGLHKIFAGVFAENIASQKLIEKCGFRKIGVLRKHYSKNGAFYDQVRYELLSEDFVE